MTEYLIGLVFGFWLGKWWFPARREQWRRIKANRAALKALKSRRQI